MKLKWDQIGEHFYETGVDHGVLYPSLGKSYGNGVAWNGLTSVNESPSGADANDSYADNIKYLSLRAAEDFGATIEAFTYPREFEVCDGSAEVAPGVLIGQQNRRPFGFSYRTLMGNDVNGQDYGYKLHLVYGCTASPSERSYSTVNESPEPLTFSWELTTVPVDVPGFKPTAIMTIDSTTCRKSALKKLEDILYGTDTTAARLPMPEEVIAIMSAPDPVSFETSVPGATEDLLGKTVNDLETDIVIREDDIGGTLKYVTDYTGFSSKPAEQKGNYLALQFTLTPPTAETTVEIIGGTSGPVKLDSDGIWIGKIADPLTQTVKVIATVGKDSVEKIYKLNNLVLLPESAVG